MLLTSNYGLKKPEETDPVDVQDFNDNADIIDKELQKRPEFSGNASNMTVEFTAATQLTELTSKDSLKGLFGKLALTVKNVIALIKLLGTADISSIGGGTVTGAINALNSDLATHKISSDHDGRYYTETEINALLGKKQDALSVSNIAVTINTTNFVSNNDSWCTFRRYGAIGIVNFSLITAKTLQSGTEYNIASLNVSAAYSARSTASCSGNISGDIAVPSDALNRIKVTPKAQLVSGTSVKGQIVVFF